MNPTKKRHEERINERESCKHFCFLANHVTIPSLCRLFKFFEHVHGSLHQKRSCFHSIFLTLYFPLLILVEYTRWLSNTHNGWDTLRIPPQLPVMIIPVQPFLISSYKDIIPSFLYFPCHLQRRHGVFRFGNYFPLLQFTILFSRELQNCRRNIFHCFPHHP